jgi:hypothetical protein
MVGLAKAAGVAALEKPVKLFNNLRNMLYKNRLKTKTKCHIYRWKMILNRADNGLACSFKRSLPVMPIFISVTFSRYRRPA